MGGDARNVHAVQDVSFTVEAGELVGFIGPNGAGKSTTIKMLSGIIAPTAGQISVNRLVPWRDRRENARQIGVVFGQRSQLVLDLPMLDSFELIRSLYGVPRRVYDTRLAELVEILGIGEFLERPVRTLSLGQRMRGDLVAAMLYAPPVLYLDEPTVGLDALAKVRIREFVAEVNRRDGTTVILTTHDLDDVESLCERIVLIDKGRIIFDGALEAFTRQMAPHRELVAVTGDDPSASTHLDRLAPGVECVARTPQGFTLRFDPERLRAAELIAMLAARVDLVDVSVKEPRLEDVIAGLYARRAADPGGKLGGARE